MTITISLALTEGSSLRIDETITLVNAPIFYYWPPTGLMLVTPGLSAMLQTLSESGAPRSELETLVIENDGPRGLLGLNKWLDILDKKALLSRTLRLDGQVIAILQPISPYFQFTEFAESSEHTYELSRFACIRKDQNALLIESARGHAALRITNANAFSAVFFTLTNPVSFAELLAAAPNLTPDLLKLILDFMLNAGVINLIDANTLAEQDDPTLASWNFHDMLFHTRSRLGRHAGNNGGYYAPTNQLSPPPIVKPRMSDVNVKLYKPDIIALKEEDIPFSRILESRVSVRKYGETAINIDQLGEFLYRTARVKKLVADAGLSFRPYAGCGGIYALEIYPFINHCDGIENGIYNYDPLDHQLCRLSNLNPEAQKLLRISTGTALIDDTPQILLIITARFQRTQSKYRHTAYSMILQDVGSLYQTMYLVAQAMGLSPVALGGGYSDLFTQATGIDYYQETSVGEFLLGYSAEKETANIAMQESGVFVSSNEESKGGFGKGVIVKGGC